MGCRPVGRERQAAGHTARSCFVWPRPSRRCRTTELRANSISPGLIETNQTREQLKDPEWASAMLGKTLLGRLGRPEEVANVALFLACEESSYVTGVDIVVDGGMKVW